MVKNFFVFLRNKVGIFLYKVFLRKFFFLFDAEFIHNKMIDFGRFLGKFYFTKRICYFFFGFSDKILEQNVLGLNFKNPIGLGAGFDKDCDLLNIIFDTGFGFSEIGSITKDSYKGNLGKRLYRLKKSKSLVVNYGLKNIGADKVYEKLHSSYYLNFKKKFKFIRKDQIFGISIAKTNSDKTCNVDLGIEDYFYSYKKFENVCDYFTINISCPNSFCPKLFEDISNLEKLFEKIFSIKKKKPVFLKISTDISFKKLDRIIDLCYKFKIDGFVVANLTKNLDDVKILDSNVPKVGGVSGKVLKDKSNILIEYIYRKTGKDFVIVGLGGVFSGEDAYEKIRLGASLVELITSMIYEGPFLISQINYDLQKFLKRDGFKSVSEAVGSGVFFKKD